MNLIQEAKESTQAFGQLYEAHFDAVYQFVAFRVRNLKDAEDLSSLIWEKVFQRIHRLRSNEDLGFKCWLFQIARNTINDYYRQSKPLLTLDPEAPLASSEASPHEALTNSSDHAAVKALIDTLPSKQKETVILSLFSDLKNKEIAKILHVSEKTVASNLSRALQYLREHLKNLQ
jgi:RNA polymerase sigma-70 factor (ECF subfamily)